MTKYLTDSFPMEGEHKSNTKKYKTIKVNIRKSLSLEILVDGCRNSKEALKTPVGSPHNSCLDIEVRGQRLSLIKSLFTQP